MLIEVTVCNVCQQVGKQTNQYEIRKGGRAVTADLCADDGEPLERLLASAPAVRMRRRKTAARESRIKTVEEIEAAKRNA